MDDAKFREALDNCMHDDSEPCFNPELKERVETESLRRGFSDWTDAYHRFECNGDY